MFKINIFYEGDKILGITTILIAIISYIILRLVIKKKKIFYSAVILLISLSLITTSYFLFFIRTTNIPFEGLGGIKISSKIEKSKIQQLENNDYYYTLKETPGIYVHVNDNIIVEITTVAELEKSDHIQTFGDISIGDTFSVVKSSYGSNYNKLHFVEMYNMGIQYYDKRSKIKITFYFNGTNENSKVESIIIKKTGSTQIR